MRTNELWQRARARSYTHPSLVCRARAKHQCSEDRMPPKSKKKAGGRGKERKARKKQEQAEVAAALAKVKAAYEMGDHMTSLQAFRKYTRNGLDVVISFHPVDQVSEEERKWTFELMKSCVREHYIRGGWGWSDREKWQELTDEASCFLLARDATSNSLVGFVSFRFDLDEGVEVLYCYEIHLCPEVRNKGLGKFLMQITELIAHRAHMRKVMLTVFKENTLSSHFFREKMKYSEDETSPLYCDPLHAEEYTYCIFSKTLVRPAAKTPATSSSSSTELPPQKTD